jgi:hypothetical protein
MRWSHLAMVVSGSLLLAACGERPARTLSPRPQADLMTAGPTCPAPDAINSEITALFSGGNQTAALSRFANIIDLVGATPPGPDTATAQEHALSLVGFTLEKFRQGTLTGGLSDATRDQVLALANGFLCVTGLPQSLSLGAMGPDGAVAVITPTSPSTTITTGTDWAGMQIDSGTVTQTVLVTISRLPDTDRLLTQLDQYPLYYEFHVTPEGALGEPVVVGVCPAASWTPPDPGRLRLAHNVPPYTAGSIEILPLHEVPFLDCSDATLAAVPTGIPLFDFARAGWRTVSPVLASLLLPQRLMAFATSGVGGTTRNFSPFGVVDTLVEMDAVSPLSQRWPVGGTVPQPPSVRLHTPLGNALVGMAVNFAVTAGGGSLTGASGVTDASGVATLGSWILGLTAGLNTVAATATPLHVGSGVARSPLTFSATALPPSRLAFLTQPSDLVAGTAIAPPVRVEVQDEDGHRVNSSAAAVAIAIGTGPSGAALGGTRTVAAAQGMATFADLSLTRAAAGYTLVAASAPLSSATSAPFSVFHAAPATILAAAGDGQTAVEGAAVATPPSVRVVDAFANPVPGVTVTFTVQNGGGSITGASAMTDASGVASVGSWILVSGANYLLATADVPSLAGNPVTFTATGTSSTATLLACPASNGAGDDLSRAFYLANYAGRSLKQVDLYLSSNASANTPTPYTIQLIAKAGGFNGAVIGTSTVTVYLRGSTSQNLLTHFVFPGAPAVQRNGTVTFQFNVLSNPDGSTLRFNVGSCGLGDAKCRTGCGIVETNDATGTLSTFRRKGCGINIIGGS